MSAIDCFPHLQLGHFCSLPIYRLKQPAKVTDLVREVVGNLHVVRQDALGPHQLLIGGGSGEHPALVVPINECLEWFLYELSYFPDARARFPEEFVFLMEELSEHIEVDPGFFINPSQPYGLDLNNWPLSTWMRVHALFPLETALDDIFCESDDELPVKMMTAMGALIAYKSLTDSSWDLSEVLHPKLALALRILGPDCLEPFIPKVLYQG